MQSRISRRFRVALVVVCALVGLVACTPPGLPAPIAPTTTPSPSSGPAADGKLLIGMDGVPVGFNPHSIADAGPVTTAMAGLVLPTVSTIDAASGARVLDRDLVDRAAVVSSDPFTVRYNLNRGAAWSDGTPITAEDFSYLRNQMLVQPGTVDPAGYRLITDIRSLDAGKTVEVEFSAPLQYWLSLFSPLLPSHLLKDSPGGWEGGLSGGLPVSGNRYKMVDYDTTTGEITLNRNDKYWAKQPGPASVVVRIGSPDSLVDALQRGDVQAILVRPDREATERLVAEVPAGRRAAVPLSATAQLVFDNTDPVTGDLALRQAVVAALDPQALRDELAGGRPGGAQPVTSMTALPSTTSSTATVPAVTDNPAAAQDFLHQAGYTRGGVYYNKGGVVLRLELAYPAGDTRFAQLAATIQTELGRLGIDVDLLRLEPGALIARVAGGTVQLALLDVARGGSDPLAAAAQFQCGQAGGTPSRTTAATSASDTTGADESAGATSVTSTETAQPPDGGTGSAVRTGNLSGYCDSSINQLLVAGLTRSPTAAEQQALDRSLWSALPVFPIAQQTAIFAVSPALGDVAGGAGPGWTFTGPLAGLPAWPAS